MQGEQASLPSTADVPLGRATPTVPGYLSFSQISMYNSCSYKYKLRYVDKVPTQSSGAALAGTAIHLAAAEAEKQGWWKTPQLIEWAIQVFKVEFDRLIERAGGEDAVRWAGRKTKEYPQGENRMWWDFMGPVMVKRYGTVRRFLAQEDFQVFPQPEIEVNVLHTLKMLGPPVTDADGNLRPGKPHQILIKGYIDVLVSLTPEGFPAVLDWKSGSWIQPEQLAVYGWLLGKRERDPIEIHKGIVIKLRKAALGDQIVQYDLEPWIPVIEELIEGAARGIGLDVYNLNPTSFCPSCFVKASCPWGKTLPEKEAF